MESHGRTGRDSVLAMHKRNDLAPKNDVSQDDIDDDLLWRIESQLIKSQDYIDLTQLRNELQKRDTNRCGIIDKVMLKHVCNEMQLPIFGALLKNLMKRCDGEKNEKICWPEFLSFLERGQENARVTCPALATLPDRQKSRTPVQPTPMDELSTKTRMSIVNKFRKKSTNKQPEIKSDVKPDNRTDREQNVLTDNPEVKASAEKPEEIKPQSNDTKILDNEVVVEKNESEQPQSKEPSVVSDQTKTDKQRHSKGKKVNHRYVHFTKLTNTEKETENDSSPATLETGLSDTTSNQDASSIPSNSTVDIDISSPNKSERGTPESPETQRTVSVADGQTDLDKNTSVEENTYVTNDDDVKLETNGVETVTFKNGQVVSCEREIELTADKADNLNDITGAEPTVVSIEVKGKRISFNTDKEYLDKQLIDPPRERMKLQWVYGYRGNDCRKNIHTLSGGEILYFMSYIAIIYNKETHKQRFYKEHTDDIKCIDVHSNRYIVASGQYANRKNTSIKALVRVWRSDNLQTLHVVGENIFEKSIACVAFAPNKDILAVVDNSLEKKLTVWDTSDGTLKGQEMLNTDLVCDIGFNMKYPETLVTIGKEHTCWWKIYPDSDTIQQAAKPEYDNFLKAKFVICLAFTDKGDMITGDSNGTIYVFGDGGNRITNFIKHAHDGPVFTVIYHRGYILSGGRDGIIHSWQYGKNMNTAGFIQIPKAEGGVRMLCICKGSLLIGTTMNSMLALSLSENDAPLTGVQFDDCLITQCHYDELRGLTTVSTCNTDVFTAGLDGIVCEYNSKERKAISKVQFKGNQYLCVDSDPTANLVALGTKDGHLQILQRNADNIWDEIINRKICKDRIDCIRISPDSRSIAAGSYDNCIYMFSHLARDDGTLVWEFCGKLKGHSGPVNGIDWSSEKTADDAYMLRSSSQAVELMYWRPETREVFHKTDIISKSGWVTHSVLVELSIAGIMTSQVSKETDMTSLDVNSNGTLAIRADTTGSIRLYRYPCSLNGSFCHSYRSHAHTYGVRFSSDGSTIMTVGGRDSCLMQWELV